MDHVGVGTHTWRGACPGSRPHSPIFGRGVGLRNRRLSVRIWLGALRISKDHPGGSIFAGPI